MLSVCKAITAPSLPQDAGMDPEGSVSDSSRLYKDGNARGSAQLGGKVPASTPDIANHGAAALNTTAT